MEIDSENLQVKLNKHSSLQHCYNHLLLLPCWRLIRLQSYNRALYALLKKRLKDKIEFILTSNHRSNGRNRTLNTYGDMVVLIKYSLLLYYN